MRIEKPAPPRHTVSNNDSAVTITIPAKKNWLWIGGLFLGSIIWLSTAVGIIGFLLITIIAQFIPENDNQKLWTISLCLIPHMVVLLSLGYFIWRKIFWYLAGKETIEIKDGAMILSNKIGRWVWSKSFDIHQVKNLLVCPKYTLATIGNLYTRAFSFRNSVSFDYGAKAYYFGNDLDDAEARQVIAEIVEEFSLRCTPVQQEAN